MSVADELIAVSDKELLAGSFTQRVLALGRVALMLRQRGVRYDQILTGYADRRYELLTCLLKSSVKRRLGSSSFGRPLVQHRSRIYEYWRLLTGRDSDSDLDFPEAARQLGVSLMKDAEQEGQATSLPAAGYVLMVPGGARNLLRTDDLRRWPVEYYVELAERLIAQGHRVVLAGGPTDAWVLDHFSSVTCEKFIGKTSLAQLVKLAENALVVVSHDTGPMHLASLSSTPLVAMFGPTPANAFVAMGRPLTEVLSLQNRVPCSPCYDGKNYAACENAQCMKRITVESVEMSVQRLARGGTV